MEILYEINLGLKSLYRTTLCDIKWESDSSSICDTSHWTAKWITFLTNQLTIHSVNYCVIWSTVPGMINRLIQSNTIKTIIFCVILYMISRHATHKPTSNWLSGFINELMHDYIQWNSNSINNSMKNLMNKSLNDSWGIWWKIQDSKVWWTIWWIIQCMIWRLIQWTVWWTSLWMNWWMVKGTLNNWCDSFY